MTLGNGSTGIKVTGREIATVLFIVAILGIGIRVGVTQERVLSGMEAIKRDVCQYSVPPEARRFAYTCRETNSGDLQAQEPR